ncbi:MAG: hypothetical protein RLZZ596_2334 [Pseudomonadota bacterium]|jgi:two-component system response regulator AlgR
MSSGLKVLLVDDEPLARSRLRSLLSEPGMPAMALLDEAASASQALALLAQQAFDLILLDIHMPGGDGMTLAHSLRQRTSTPAVVFVTAHDEHALQAFEVQAIDYLTKPVRRQRLQQALEKVLRITGAGQDLPPELGSAYLIIHAHGRSERVALSEVLYLKAELKYLTVRTASASHILAASLSEIEAHYPNYFIRIHRNTLVARSAMRALEHHHAAGDIDGWTLRLQGLQELLPVSRRQLAAVRSALLGG